MTRKEIEINHNKRIKRLINILENGKLIGVATFDNNNEYWLKDNIVWYIPRRSKTINQGSLEDFKADIVNNKIKVRLI